MQSYQGVKRLGLTVGACLAVPYTLLTIASLILMEKGMSGSMQAALLGVEANAVVGIDAGLLGLVVLGFAVAAVFVALRKTIRGATAGKASRMTQEAGSMSIAGSRSFRLLAGLFVLIPVALFGLRALAPALSSNSRAGTGVAHAQAPKGGIQAENLGPTINTAYREAEPSFTADGRTMYFNCYNGDICVSHLLSSWTDGNWTTPQRLPAPVNTEYEEVEPVINGAGDTLYFTSVRPAGFLKRVPFLSPFMNVLEIINRVKTMKGGRPWFGGAGLDDVYVSHLSNGAWSEAQSINDVPGEPAINTIYADHCLLFSADGNEAFWTSTRPGGYGGNDIWTSRRVDGKWTAPENLGPNVNGPSSEHAPTPTPDGRALYVTSDRPGGFGGDDIYITTRGADGTWGPLVNLGPAVNGAGDDRCPAWTPDLKYFLFDSIRAGGDGARDIWWLPFRDVQGYPQAADAGSKQAAKSAASLSD